MSDLQALADFRAICEPMHGAIAELLDALAQEAACLGQRDPLRLSEIADHKSRLVDLINDLTRRQQLWLQEHSYSNVDELLTKIASDDDPMDTTVRTLWDEIMQMGKACKKQNELNGAYLDLLRQHVDRALDIIYRQNGQTTYGPDGAARISKGSVRTSFSV